MTVLITSVVTLDSSKGTTGRFRPVLSPTRLYKQFIASVVERVICFNDREVVVAKHEETKQKKVFPSKKSEVIFFRCFILDQHPSDLHALPVNKKHCTYPRPLHFIKSHSCSASGHVACSGAELNCEAIVPFKIIVFWDREFESHSRHGRTFCSVACNPVYG